MASKSDIKKSLLAQLVEIGADTAHFRDLVEDYMDLVGVKNGLISDIKKRGVMYKDVSSVGVEMMKNNPSVKELTLVNRQMLMILRELGLRTNKLGAGGEDIDL